jgi:hypothetical protein
MFRFSCIALAVFLLAACSPKDNADQKKAEDSIAALKPEFFQTDSGRLEVPVRDGKKNGAAVLRNAAGVVVGSGLFVNDIQAGVWKRFDTSGKLIAVNQFSAGKAVRTLDITDFEKRKFENAAMNIRLSIPKLWTEVESPNPALMAVFEKKTTDSTVVQPPAVNVVKAVLGKNETLEKLAADHLNLLHQSINRVEVIDEQYFTLKKTTGFRRYGMYNVDNLNVGFMNAILINGNDVYVFNCVADNSKPGDFLAYQAVFDELVESFEPIK